jgi:hypothetical protein
MHPSSCRCASLQQCRDDLANIAMSIIVAIWPAVRLICRYLQVVGAAGPDSCVQVSQSDSFADTVRYYIMAPARALMKLFPDFGLSFRFFSILGVSLDEATRYFHRSFKIFFPFLTVGVCRDQTSTMMVKHRPASLHKLSAT